MKTPTRGPLLSIFALAASVSACSSGAMTPAAPSAAMAAPGAPSLDAAGAAAVASPAPPPPAQADAMRVMSKTNAPEKKDAEEAKTWKRSGLGAHSLHLRVGDHEELPISSVQANVTVDGSRARVVLDVVVKNPNDRGYEGTFQLRLPEGASPYFFAFGEEVVKIAGAPMELLPTDQARAMTPDPAGIMAAHASLWSGPKEARMVAREKAASAYRDTMRRAIDPAIMEWSGPGIFSARVFPLSAKHSHRIVVGYDVPLRRIGADLEYVFDLPHDVPSTLVDLSVREPSGASLSAMPASKPVTTADGRAWYRFDGIGGAPASGPAGSTAPNEIAIRVKSPAPATLVSATHFAADVVPALVAGAGVGRPDTALFLLDTSLSSNPDRFNVWLKLLGSILRNNRDAIKRFNVELFSVDQRFLRPTFVENDDANLAEVMRLASEVALEGATDLSAAIRRAASAPGAPGGSSRFDVFLLSDGASTWGESDPFVTTRAVASSGIASLFAYQTGLAGTDGESLSLLARELGGAVFSVTGDAEVEKASRAHRERPLKLVSAKVDGGVDVLLAGRPRFLFPGQTVHVAGRGAPVKGADLELVLEEGGAPRTVHVPLGGAIASPLATRAYGQIAVGQIEELSPTTDETATAFARHFRVPGKTASLLMLENESDYRRLGDTGENDDKIVEKNAASNVVEGAIAQVAGSLGDPKRAFQTWLAELPRRSGVSFELPLGFNEALAQMPAASFGVTAAPLVVKHDGRGDVPATWLTALSTHGVDYDGATAEADRRLNRYGAGDALKALSSLVEENPGDAVLARDVGMSAMLWGLPADAFHLFRRVAIARPFEPPTYRAEAEAMARLGKIDLAMAYFEVGLAGHWDNRFGDFHEILAVEYRELLRRVVAGELATSVPAYAKQRLATLTEQATVTQADVVVMITWNTDGTDVDLHVVEPSGEDCMYSHRTTAMGGQLTRDVTTGYGPEMYVLPHAKPGRYQIRAHYFASDRTRASARTKVHALVFEQFGTPHQHVTEKTVVLETGKEMHDILQLDVRGGGAKIAGG